MKAVWDGLVLIGALVLVLVSFLAVTALVYLDHDLRGWPPREPLSPATIVEPTLPGKRAFTLKECVPGAIRPYEPPFAEEYSGTATVVVLTCRSRSSADMIWLSYLAAVIASLAVAIVLHRVRSRESRAP